MRNIIAFPLIGLIVILQTAVVSQIQLLNGYADLPLVLLAAWSLQPRVTTAWQWATIACVMVGFISKLPWVIYVAGYLAVVFFAQTLQRRVWQAPLLAMFSVTFAGTAFLHLLSFSVLRLLGTPLAFGDVLALITVPSLLLNMLLAIPMYTIMRDVARWVYAAEAIE